MKLIQLTNGMVSQVDDEDYEKYGHLTWRMMTNGYVRRTEQRNGKQIWFLLHRVIAGAEPGEHVHHRDGNRLNNQRDNLERLSPFDHHHSHQLARGPRQGEYKGTTWDRRKRKWMAQINVADSHRFLGYFETEERAARAYDKAALEAWGEGAYLNFPDLVHEPLPAIRRRFRYQYRGINYSKRARHWKCWHQSYGRKVYLGSFKTAEEAAVAFDRANYAVHGDAAPLNFPCMIWYYRKSKSPLVRRKSPTGQEKPLDIPLFAEP